MKRFQHLQDIEVEKMVLTFWNDPTTNKWKGELGTCPNETEVKWQLKSRRANSSLDLTMRG